MYEIQMMLKNKFFTPNKIFLIIKLCIGQTNYVMKIKNAFSILQQNKNKIEVFAS